MPYCKFGENQETGVEVSDSNVIIDLLQQQHTTTDLTLSPMNRAIAHTIIRMLEEHTAQVGFYYRYALQIREFVDVLEIGDRFGNPPAFTQRWMEKQPSWTKEKTKIRGLTKHSDEALWKFSFDDLKALEDILGDDKQFFFGSVPTLVDCAVFGHVSQFLWIPIDFPQQAFLKEQCPNLVRFMEHFRSTYWHDWEECCQKKPNQKYAKKKEEGIAEEKKE